MTGLTVCIPFQREKALGESFRLELRVLPLSFSVKAERIPALKGHEESSIYAFEVGWYHGSFRPMCMDGALFFCR